jgi:hypothetical protein
LQPPSSET